MAAFLSMVPHPRGGVNFQTQHTPSPDKCQPIWCSFVLPFSSKRFGCLGPRYAGAGAKKRARPKGRTRFVSVWG
ncbi:hypothetical protein HMPREF0262_03251 [Clostridium sp. ATCC 29733]|nr:hypothetical protein HMPREF0262_03251 [Clostridium sp. ATCC 29733]